MGSRGLGMIWEYPILSGAARKASAVKYQSFNNSRVENDSCLFSSYKKNRIFCVLLGECSKGTISLFLRYKFYVAFHVCLKYSGCPKIATRRLVR